MAATSTYVEVTDAVNAASRAGGPGTDGRDAVPERSRDAGDLHSRAQQSDRATRKHRGRSHWSPTTAARDGVHRNCRATWERGWSELAAKGYGNALMGGIAAAAGKYVVMGDADASYDFAHIPRFLGNAARGRGPGDGQPLPGRDCTGCDAAAAPVPGQPGADLASGGCSSATAQSATFTAACADFARTRISA